MKIAIAGAHGVGKSSFAKELAKRMNLNYIPDIVREEAVPKGFVINENTPSEVQLWLVFRQWELEQITPESWVADKSLLDYLVYGKIVLKEKDVEELIEKIIKRNIGYDQVFYLPIEFPMESDGIRSDNEDFRKEVDCLYKETLKELGIKHIPLSGSVEQRIVQALEYLK